MQDKINSIYPICSENGCFESVSAIAFGVKENARGRSVVVETSTQNVDFVIENPSGKNIGFLAIDHCLFNDTCGHKKCDFAVFDESCVCFVELKQTTKSSRRGKHREDAFCQLWDTIQKVTSQIQDINRSIEACMAFTYKPARPIVVSAMQSKRMLLKETFGADLFEGNHKTF